MTHQTDVDVLLKFMGPSCVAPGKEYFDDACTVLSAARPAVVGNTLSQRQGTAVPLSPTALMILQKRFFRSGPNGDTLEDAHALFERVAVCLSSVEVTPAQQSFWHDRFYEVMAGFQFHPSSRVLANAGTSIPQLQNCFVFPLEDDQNQILRTLHHSALVKGLGGGCGFDYSHIRPAEDVVRETAGLAVGPVRLLPLFDLVSSRFRQQGRYESGNMAVLDVSHPDVLDFIAAKNADGFLSHTNLSLGIPDRFMIAVSDDEAWPLVNPRTGAVVRQIGARDLFEKACAAAVNTGDPGLLFLDHINRHNPLRHKLGDIRATNPCGEIGLYPYESCNLGYLNLTKFLKPQALRHDGEIFDIRQLSAAVAVGVRMVDNAISASAYPLPEIREATLKNRRLGLGVTGWADCLSISGVAYDSDEALELGDRLGAAIRLAAQRASLALGSEKGPFPNVDLTTWPADYRPRNVAVLGFPPSGNNALIFDTSFSIEPHYAMAYTEIVMGDRQLTHLNRHLAAALRERSLWTDSIVDQIIAEGGSVQSLQGIPTDIKRVYKTAQEIEPHWHVRMQAAFQQHVDNAITKTVNLPKHATVNDVMSVFQTAWRLGCKGITVYRQSTRTGQTFDIRYAEPASACGPDCA